MGPRQQIDTLVASRIRSAGQTAVVYASSYAAALPGPAVNSRDLTTRSDLDGATPRGLAFTVKSLISVERSHRLEIAVHDADAA
jgi:hypothetical protein